MTWVLTTEEHKEQAQEEQSEFKMRIAAERKAEAEELEQRQAEEALVRAMKSKPAPKPKRKYKKRLKKPAKKPMSLKIEPVVVRPRVLPVYHQQVEVNEFNKFKVDYIRRQIHHCKDPQRKAIYVNALNKYDMTNYHNLK